MLTLEKEIFNDQERINDHGLREVCVWSRTFCLLPKVPLTMGCFDPIARAVSVATTIEWMCTRTRDLHRLPDIANPTVTDYVVPEPLAHDTRECGDN